MKCSVIISVLESHEIFRRQMLRFNRIMPSGFELIILDDGSEVPLTYDAPLRVPFRLIHTNDRRPWTPNIARTRGAAIANGDYLLMTDIDHIFTPEALDAVSCFQGDMLEFARRYGSLDENGKVSDPQQMIHSHVNTFAIRKELFQRTGYGGDYIGYGDDRVFRQRYQNLVSQNQAAKAEIGPAIFVIREQRWFHNLPRTMKS